MSSAQWNVCKGDERSSDLHSKHRVSRVTPQFRGALGLQDQGRRGAPGVPGGTGRPAGEGQQHRPGQKLLEDMGSGFTC